MSGHSAPSSPALPAFPLAEYEQRITNLQRDLAAHGIGAAILSNASNVVYYGGFRTTIRASNLVWAMLVVPDRGEPHAIVSQAVANLFRESSWIANVHAFGGAPYWGLPSDPLDLVRDLIPSSACRIGMERGGAMRPELTVAEIERLNGFLNGRDVADVSPFMWRQRVVKSAWELELYRTLGRITAAGFRAGLEAIALGVSEREIERRMWRAFIDGGADASPVGGQLMIRSGRERYGTFCGRASARTLEAGDQIILAGGPALSGYHIDIHRFACVPPVPDLQHELHAQSEAGLTAAIEATRPGVAAKTVFKAARDAMRRRAATAVIPWRVFGHGVGLDNYEPPMIGEDDETILETGMVLALEVPAYDIPAGRVLGAFLEDCIVVTDSGAEVLTAGVGRALWAG